VQCLGERIDLIGVETSRKRQDLTEFIEPGRLLGQPDRSRLDPGRLSVHPHHLVTHRVPEDESFDIGQDTRTPLALIEYRYDVPFTFTGRSAS
jgi:hypothetical protein